MAARYFTITLESRGVTCRARLLDDEAPLTCQAVWQALPAGSDAFSVSSLALTAAMVSSAFFPERVCLEFRL